MENNQTFRDDQHYRFWSGVSHSVRTASHRKGDFFVLMIVAIADVILGFFQEYQAPKNHTALKNLVPPAATVIWGGK